MSSLDPAALLAQLEWRYATKVFDPTRTIPEATWEILERALVLTPSSFGLQPWHFLVLTDRALRERLLPHAWNQRQVVDSSHLVVLCSRTDTGETEIDRLIARIQEVRGTPTEKLTGLRRSMVSALVQGSFRPMIREWAIRQAYIALGNFMTAAAVIGVDTCPLEGFQPERFDEILGLGPRGLISTVCCAAGYRAATDKYAGQPKVRFPVSEVVERR